MSLAGLLQHQGAAVTFTAVAQTQNDATGQMTSTSATVSGYARRIRGELRELEALGLIGKEAITLLFTPSTAGECPALQSTVEWGGQTFTVKSIDPAGPAGVIESARVIAAR